ncbi:MAG: tRNA guanosine(34) transglycosylase Tgt [Candidatus Woesearchaeota archaeon]
MTFEIMAEDGQARTGLLHTAHGKVQTPFFMPVASKGSVKAMRGDELEDIGFESIISNAFLLSLVPGTDVVEGIGGIHDFMNFKKTIFTDSGGFQVLSKDFLLKKSEEGVLFKDKRGKKMNYTPENSVETQMRLGSDVAMTLDDVTHYGQSGKEFVDAIKRTHSWARRSLLHHKKLKKETDSKQLLFGISQGGVRPEYRRFSTNKINELDFDGIALGGLVIGEKRHELLGNIKVAVDTIDKHKVKYLMGLGSPAEIIQAVAMGVDCFDSIYPTANARHGSMLTREGRLAVKKVKYKHDYGPIEDGCQCHTCRNYSKAYLHHLLREHELLGYKLATIHNLHFMTTFMNDIREAINKGDFEEFVNEFLETYYSKQERKEMFYHIQQKYKEAEEAKKTPYLLPYKP